MTNAHKQSSGTPASTTQRNHRLSECFNRGVHLATCEKNYDYAHAMFAECVLHDPGNLQFVEAMVQNLRAKTPRGKSSIFKIRRRTDRELTKTLQHKDWPNVLRIGVDLLKLHPWNVTTLRAMAEACAALHYNEVELVYLKQALESEPKNIDVNRHCARSLGRMGQFDQAIACWHRIEKLSGKDSEATRMISELAEEKLRYPNGRPPTRQVEKVTVAEPVQEVVSQEVVVSPQQKLEQAIKQDPQNPDNYVELVEILLKSDRFGEAETLLNRAIAQCGEQRLLVEKLGRVRYLRADEQHRISEERAIQRAIESAPVRFPWLELGLGAAGLLLASQLIPSVGAATWKIIDFPQWSKLGWMLFNIVILFGLISLRFLPDIRAYIKRRRVLKKSRISAASQKG